MRENTRRRLRRAVAARAGCCEGYETDTRCAFCGRVITVDWTTDPEPRFLERDGTIAHLDHLIPESKNGPTSLDNTVVACAIRNVAKGDSAVGEPEFLAWLEGRRMPIGFEDLYELWAAAGADTRWPQ